MLKQFITVQVNLAIKALEKMYYLSIRTDLPVNVKDLLRSMHNAITQASPESFVLLWNDHDILDYEIEKWPKE